MGLGLGLGYLQTGPFLDHLAVIINHNVIFKKKSAAVDFESLLSSTFLKRNPEEKENFDHYDAGGNLIQMVRHLQPFQHDNYALGYM